MAPVDAGFDCAVGAEQARPSDQPGVSRPQWSQRSQSRSGARTIMSSCPKMRHQSEKDISTTC